MTLESERYMSQHNVRFNTYDPAVEKVLLQLKSCNKQAAFVGEAIKYYLGSKQGRNAADLMCRKKTTRSAKARNDDKRIHEGVPGEKSQTILSPQSNVNRQSLFVATDSEGATQKSVTLVTGASQCTFIDKLFDLKEKR